MCSVDISVAHGGWQDITEPPYSSVIIYADLPNFTVVRLASLKMLRLRQHRRHHGRRPSFFIVIGNVIIVNEK